MKKSYLLLSLALVSGMASARQISESEARSIAISRIPSLANTAVRVQGRDIPSSADKAPVYLFNSPQGGFAIVAGDDRMPNMLLAYSDSGRLDLDNCSPAMKAWLDEISNVISNGNFSVIRRVEGIDYSNPVSPLVTAKWNQDEPYNLMTPLGSTGEHCPTGCPATAAAQVMKYWEFPKEGGLAEHSYECNGQTLSVDFRESRYDWANMADVYDDNSTEAQKNAVAKLMADCGVAFDMAYGDDSSGSYDFNVAIGLVDYLGYNPGIRLRSRNYIPDDEWFALVKNELDEARPVLYFGATVNEEGHAFVCDGYDTSGLYHINWGWGGVSNGYFDLSTLNPDAQGIGGAESGQGFSEEQNIITGLRPAKEGDIAASGWEMVVNDFDMSADNEDASMFSFTVDVCNVGYRPFTGKITLLLSRDDLPDEAEEIDLGEITTESPVYCNEGRNLGLEEIDASSMEDGLYRMQLVAYGTGSDEPALVNRSNMSLPLRFEIKDGKMNFEYRPTLTITDGDLDEFGFYYTTENGVRANLANLNFRVENTSDVVFLSTLGLDVTYPDMNGGSINEVCNLGDIPTIAPGIAYDLSVPFRYNVQGPVKIKIVSLARTDCDLQETIFVDNEIEFDAENFYHELELTDMPEITEEEGKVTIAADITCCTGSVELFDGCADADMESETEKQIYCFIYKEDPKHLVTTLTETYKGKWNESKTILFKTKDPLELGNYSAVLTYQSDPDAAGDKLDLNLGEENEGFPGISFTVTTTSAVNGIEVEPGNENAVIYSACGLRMTGADNLAPGCYIVVKDGKTQKMIVK